MEAYDGGGGGGRRAGTGEQDKRESPSRLKISDRAPSQDKRMRETKIIYDCMHVLWASIKSIQSTALDCFMHHLSFFKDARYFVPKL